MKNKMTKQEKPEGWEDTLNDLIRANFNYENTNLALKKKYGDAGAVGGGYISNIQVEINRR